MISRFTSATGSDIRVGECLMGEYFDGEGHAILI